MGLQNHFELYATANVSIKTQTSPAQTLSGCLDKQLMRGYQMYLHFSLACEDISTNSSIIQVRFN